MGKLGTQVAWIVGRFRALPWPAIGGVLGGIAALVAILEFLGVSRLSEIKLFSKAVPVAGLFVQFRNTDLQFSFENSGDEAWYISSGEMNVRSAVHQQSFSLATCCGVDSNVLPPDTTQIVYLRAPSTGSQFDFYRHTLLRHKDSDVSVSVTVNLRRLSGDVSQLAFEVPSEDVQRWIDESLEQLVAYCTKASGNKPRFCADLY